jgi:hypothetical protein
LVPIRPGIVKHGQSGRLAQEAMKLFRYPEKAMPDEGITIYAEAYTDGSWQLHPCNRLAR